ncbi:MAG: polysaccharide deacetylase family protein [Rhizobiales bacterium]|nr:polysaccharide deacetylase family protein [Hyphomicrobiales bacterium]
MRWFAAQAIVLALISASPAMAADDCPGKPDAIGTSRTIVVDPRGHPQIGTINYSETLPLADREVVLTFDDGPRPPFTTKVLEILAAECVKATFFTIGQMAEAYPEELRKLRDAGHTIGTHSYTHPTYFDAISRDRAELEIEVGVASAAVVLGDRNDVSPFFRYPGLGRTMASEDHLAKRGMMAWSADVLADDWKRVSARDIVNRAITRLEARGKGILLLHDIHPATVVALPTLLRTLKEHGFRIVHVVPATADRLKTATAPQDWAAPWAAQKRWPRLYPFARGAIDDELLVPGAQIFQITDNIARTAVTRTVRTVTVEKVKGRYYRRIVQHHRIVEYEPPARTAWPAPAQDNVSAEPVLPVPSLASAGVEYALRPEAEDGRWPLAESALGIEIGATRVRTVAFDPLGGMQSLPTK